MFLRAIVDLVAHTVRDDDEPSIKGKLRQAFF